MPKQRVLIPGGAGYIGSHVVFCVLATRKYKVTGASCSLFLHFPWEFCAALNPAGRSLPEHVRNLSASKLDKS